MHRPSGNCENKTVKNNLENIGENENKEKRKSNQERPLRAKGACDFTEHQTSKLENEMT